MSGLFRDFNKIIPEVRVAKLGDKEIDVSKIPSRLALEVAKFRDRILTDSKMTWAEQEDGTLDIVARICQVSDKSVTVDWLLDNTFYKQLLDFIDFVMEPINFPHGKPEKITKKDKKKD